MKRTYASVEDAYAALSESNPAWDIRNMWLKLSPKEQEVFLHWAVGSPPGGVGAFIERLQEIIYAERPAEDIFKEMRMLHRKALRAIRQAEKVKRS